MSPSCMARSLRGSGAPGTQRVQNRERRSHPWRSAAALGAKVRAQLGRGQSPLSSPEAVAKPRVLEPNLVALAHSRAAPPPRLFGLGVPADLPAPRGLPADTALAPPRAPRTPSERRGTLQRSSGWSPGPGPPPASRCAGRVSTAPRPSYQLGRAVGPRAALRGAPPPRAPGKGY